jgi:hypothetical protein
MLGDPEVVCRRLRELPRMRSTARDQAKDGASAHREARPLASPLAQGFVGDFSDFRVVDERKCSAGWVVRA